MSYQKGFIDFRDIYSKDSSSSGERGLSGIGFKLTDDGNYDMENKELTNVKNAIDLYDACIKVYVDQHIHSEGSKTMSGDFDMGDNQIINLVAGVHVKDAVNVSQLNTKIDKTQFKTEKNAFQNQFD